MFEQFSRTFLEPYGEPWFRLGLIIESASPETVAEGLARLPSALPEITFDLLSRRARPEMPLRHTFVVKRPLGGLRLVWYARKHYELVVFFGTGKRELALCRAFALLVMRPRRFFMFNEFGDGFWLDRDRWEQLRGHLERRYDWPTRRAQWQRQWRKFSKACRRFGHKASRGLVWAVQLPRRITLLVGAAALFVPALLLLAVFRTTYDTYYYRFRFFGKSASAPRLKLDEAAAENAETAAAAGAGLSADHAGPPQQARPPAPEPAGRSPEKIGKLTITGACDGLDWTPGALRLGSETFLTFWVSGLPARADCASLRVYLDGTRLNLEYVTPPGAGVRQVNVRLPGGLYPGVYDLYVVIEEAESPPFPIRLV